MLKIKGELDRALRLQTFLRSASCFNGRDRGPTQETPIPTIPKEKSKLEYYTDPDTGELLARPRK